MSAKPSATTRREATRQRIRAGRFELTWPRRDGFDGPGKEVTDMGQVVIASRLADGLVVFLKEAEAAGQADWVLQLAEAEVASDDSRASELLSIAETDGATHHTIVDAYLIDVAEEGGVIRPTKYREVIRCAGPSIRLDLGKQSEGATDVEN